METSFLFTALLSLGILFIVVIRPLFLQAPTIYYRQLDPEKEKDIQESKLLQSLQEIKTDYEMGKLSEKDFEELSLEYQKRYLQAQKEEL